MLVTASAHGSLGTEPFDVAVIGAGVVGIFCAVQLERRGLRVALIEGGGVTPDTLSNAAFTTLAGRNHSTLESGRAMGLGGTGLLWGGQLSEFSASDLSGGKGYWPIAFEELHDLYGRVYHELGLPPRLDNRQARQSFGGDEGTLAGIERIFSYWLPNPNLAGVFRETLTRSSKLAVFVNCKATGLNFDTSGHANSIKLMAGSEARELHAHTVVIAGGVVESARFALAAQRDAHCPWKDNAHIGLAFQDHVGGHFGRLDVRNLRRFRDSFETAFSHGLKYMPKLRYVDMSTATGEQLSVCAFPSFHSNISEHIANIKMLLKAFRTGTSYGKWHELPASVAKVGRAFLPLVWRYASERRVLALMDQGVDLAFQCEQLPTAASRITLAEGNTAADGLPPVVVDWRTTADEPEFLRAAALRFADYFDKTGCAELKIDSQLLDDPKAFFERLRDTSHPCGGLCMSEDPSRGATDCFGRLWGSPNVYAAGASVLATSGEANITLTALAMALRLTDHLGGQSVARNAELVPGTCAS